MSAGKQVSIFRFLKGMSYCLLLLVSSCIVPKRYQPYKPFVFKTNITVNAKMPTSQKQELTDKLRNQLDDSLKVRTVYSVRLVPPFLYKRLSKPPVFDTINVSRSRLFMKALLNSQGYFYSEIRDTVFVDTLGNQYRVTVEFRVIPGKQLRIDSTGYFLTTPELQQLTLNNQKGSLLKKGHPYSLQLVSSELERLLDIYRNNGYYKISREDVYAEVDTVIAALINPTLDPFEQVRLLAELRKRRENPTINVVIKQRVAKDTNRLKKFYVGDVTIYPDLAILRERLDSTRYDTIINGYRFRYNSHRFQLRFLASRVAIKPHTLYQQKNYFKTTNAFTQLGAWQNVGVELLERYDTVPLLDAIIKLYPAKRRSLSVDLETSVNIGDYISTGYLFGTGFNIRILDRNAYKGAIQTSSNGRLGVEFGSNFIQTLQANVSHSIFFPRLIVPLIKFPNEDSLSNPRTILNGNAAFTDRRQFYQVRSVNISWGYEVGIKRWILQYIPFNIEYTAVNETDSLRKLKELIPSLQYSFNNGLIMSQIFSANRVWARNNKLSYFKGRLESSGALFGLIEKLDKGELRRFIKVEGDFRHFINYKRSSWAFRSYLGVGDAYGRAGDQPEYKLPFYKAFFGGGPYSMRAWQVRRLGPGTTLIYDTTGGASNDRFGNMQLEENIEFRFKLTTIAGIKVNSAFFVDMGNIWGIEFDKAGNRLPEAEFNLSKLYKDLAVGGGASLRFDFDFFLIRLDWAYKLKNPSFANENNGWFRHIDISRGQFQLGIGYPF